VFIFVFFLLEKNGSDEINNNLENYLFGLDIIMCKIISIFCFVWKTTQIQFGLEKCMEEMQHYYADTNQGLRWYEPGTTLIRTRDYADTNQGPRW
jgi:hypothetical protein